MKKIILLAIKLYQKTISPDHGVFSGGKQRACRFYPTCSQYTYEAIESRGIIRGVGLGLWRILRCNPFSKGGHDPVRLKNYHKNKEECQKNKLAKGVG